MANIITNINQACADLTNIKTAIENTGVTIASGSPSSEYANKVSEIPQNTLNNWMYEYQRHGGTYVNNYCMYMYAGRGWTNNTFNPIYDIRPINANGMFVYSGIIGNISKICEEKGVALDFSRCTGMNQIFQLSGITGVDTVDTRKCDDLRTAFAGATNLVEFNDLILKDDGSQTFGNSSFSSCDALETLKITGVIGMTVSIKDSPLNRASIENVVNCLSSTATGQTLTLNKAAVEAAFTAEEWAALIATKTNWTISLV